MADSVKRWRRRFPAVLSLLLSVVLVVGALIYEGVATAEVDVDDGGIWVTNRSRHLVGHLNYESRTLDSALRTQSADFDIAQFKETVTFSDASLFAVAPIEVANVRLGAATSMPPQSQVAQGAQRLGVLDPNEGNVWVTSAVTPSSVPFSEETALATDMEAGVLTASHNGAVFALSAQGNMVGIYPDGALDRVVRIPVSGLSKTAKLQLTAVGDQPVGYDSVTNTLILPDGSLRDLGKESVASGGVLQEPGPDAESVLLATDAALVEIPLNGDPVLFHPASEASRSGVPAAPVRHMGCAYSAWAGSGAYIRVCADAGLSLQMEVDSLKTASEIQFRTNRTRIVLNETGTGSVWLPDNNMVLMDDWDQIDSQLRKEENLEDSPQITDEIADPERQEQNTPPEAVDDEFGVRPGRTTTLPVLMNDSDADGDVLTARPVTQPSQGDIARTRGGRALQISGLDEGAASTTFVYEASDGQAVDTATVRVDVRPWSMNEGPRQLRDPGVKLGASAQIEYNLLADWIDPDGDAVFLQDVSGSESLEVQFRKEGTVSIRDLGAQPGAHTLVVTVSDGRESTAGTLTVHVQQPGNLPPIVNADFYVIPVGETAVIEPLANDNDPNGDRLKLVAVSVAPAGAVLTPDLELGSVSFVARAKGSYHFTYTVTDGPSTALGVVRVDVVDVDAKAAPVAEDDLAVLPAGGFVHVAPLSNDSDPSGGVLVVQRIEVPEGAGLEVILIDRHLLRISAPSGLDKAVSVPYVVSNGVSTASALVTVVPSEALDDKQPPRLQPDRAKVRVGDIASVRVLANDMSPAGLAMRVDPVLEFTPEPEVGTPFVTGNLVRLAAGERPGVMHVSYTVRDSVGNLATSTVLFEVRPLEGTNAAPQPKALTAWAVSGQTARIPVPLNGIDPDGDSVTLVGIEQSPTKGSVALGVDWLEYTPAPNTTGTDVFTYIVEDRLGKQSSARVRVGIAAPDAYNQNPAAVRDTVRARPNRSLYIAVLVNDIDADGDTVALIEGSLESNTSEISPVINGSVVSLTTPAAEGSYVISYGITDGRGGQATGTLTVIVSEDAPLRGPIARDDVVTLAEMPTSGGPVTVKVLSNDEDPDGNSQALKISAQADGVTVDGNVLRITPSEKRRMVVYTVTDEDGLSAVAIVSVPGVERTRPSIDESKFPIEVRAGQEVSLDITDYVQVRAGRTPRIVNPSSAKGAAGIEPEITVEKERIIRLRVREDFVGKTSVSFEARDGAHDDESALSAVLMIPLKVIAAVNTPPTFTPTPIRVSAGGDPVRVELAQMVNDPDGQDPAGFTYALGGVPDGVSVTLSGSQLAVQARLDQQKGPVGMITVSVDDGSGEVQAFIPVSVVASTRPLIQTSDALVNAANAGGRELIDLTRYTINPFPETPLRIVGASVQLGEGTVDPQGTTLAITPAVGFHGQMTVLYRLMDATGDPDRAVEGRVRLVVRDRPEAPTGVSAQVIGAGRAVVSFQPGSDNGAEIEGFTITDHYSGRTYECRVASCPLEGLDNGVEHSFTVVARNAVGVSDSSTRSAPILVDARPGMPNPPTVSPGDGEVTVTWTPPQNEGSAIRHYTLFVAGDPSKEIQVDGALTSTTVKGLKNGVGYYFTIQAHNSAPEPSPISEASSAAVPFGPPGAPLSVRAQAVNALDASTVEVDISWDYPPLNGRKVDRVRIEIEGMGTHEESVTPEKNSVRMKVAAASDYRVRVALRNEENQWSGVAETRFDAFGLPLAPPRPSARATGNSREIELVDVAKAPGNGFSADALTIEWTPKDQESWTPVTPRILLPSNGRQWISVRQRAVGIGQKVVFSEVVTIEVHPYAPPGTPELSGRQEGASLVYSWSLNSDGIGQALRSVELIINGSSYAVGIDQNRYVLPDVQPGGEYQASLTVTAEDGRKADSGVVSIRIPGRIEGRLLECPVEEGPLEPENPTPDIPDPNNPAPDLPPPPRPDCKRLELQGVSWHPSIPSLTCTIWHDGRHVEREVSTSQWTPTDLTLVNVDENDLPLWISKSVECRPH
ncbi:Ig-like domain-containing protein [Schaalia sp. Marseille-Q2122]|uniref:Ig-like domain-containing protein n=1 Tax=Schaalia sp. Marseille-Q2122 TaxID=2736604 RepID=UPI00158DFF34|nr:Ig-like domain-containing protein [Schaalia sp. Marseille-Q2122]